MHIQEITLHLYKIWGLTPAQLRSIDGVAEVVPTRGAFCLVAISRNRAPQPALDAIRALAETDAETKASNPQ